MSGDVLERVRMCVAEAGYDPELVWDIRDEPVTDTIWWSADLPNEVVWRAAELVGLGSPQCRTCFDDDSEQDPSTGNLCLADRRLVEDCGRTR